MEVMKGHEASPMSDNCMMVLLVKHRGINRVSASGYSANTVPILSKPDPKRVANMVHRKFQSQLKSLSLVRDSWYAVQVFLTRECSNVKHVWILFCIRYANFDDIAAGRLRK